jgi:glycosyltransferase involved in cell wall biosynthesis
MRIMILAQFYPPDIGGEERHARNLATALAQRGHRVDVVTTALPSAPAGERDEDGVVVHRITSSMQSIGRLYTDAGRPHALPLADPAMSRAIASLMSTEHYDVAHAHNWIVNSAIGPARATSTPLVLTLHDYGHVCAVKRYVRNGDECIGPAPTRCMACAARHYGVLMGPPVAVANALAVERRRSGVATFIAVSRAVAEHNRLREFGVTHEVIPNFVPDELLVDELQSVPDAPLVYVGDLMADKGVGTLIEAYRRLVSPPRLVLVGRRTPGFTLHEGPGIVVLDPLPHDQAMTFMRSARAVIVPSIVPDACPTVVIEAMAAGRPVVASARGGIVDLVDDEVTGYLVAPSDPIALGAALERIVDDPQSAAVMGKAARERAGRFVASRVVSDIEAVYRRTVETG